MFRIVPKRCLNNTLYRFASRFKSKSIQAFATNSTTPFSTSSTFDSSTTSLPSPHPRNFADYRQHSAIEGFYWRSPFGSIRMPDVTVDQYVWQNLSKWPNKVAIVCGITGRQYTYAQLRDHCAAVAHRLRTEYDLKRGDVVAISMPNVPEYAIAVLGAMEAGLTVTTINPAYTKHEHVKQLAMSGAKLLFGMAEGAELLRESVTQVASEQKSGSIMPVVVLRINSGETMPSDVRDFAELMKLSRMYIELIMLFSTALISL